MTTGNKIMWKRGEIAPHEQFHLFSTLLYIYISNFRSQITYSLLNVVIQFIVFLTLSTLICRSTDISKCFSESLGIRDNGSRLYFHGSIKLLCTCTACPEKMKIKVFWPSRIYPKYYEIIPPCHTCPNTLTKQCHLLM